MTNADLAMAEIEFRNRDLFQFAAWCKRNELSLITPRFISDWTAAAPCSHHR